MLPQDNDRIETVVLVVNTGSSSVKMACIRMPCETVLAEASVQKLGSSQASLSLKTIHETFNIAFDGESHERGIQQCLDALLDQVGMAKISALGHRVVHGGEQFIGPTVLDAAVLEHIESLSHLAPLHNPSNILGIRAAMKCLPDVPHIAVFDTAFHHAMPAHASFYAVPYDWYAKHGVRRYGFHGTSHHYVGEQAAQRLGRAFNACDFITVHLGNGCSATAIAGGISVDTTMGMTPLEGLVMGTRSGDIDPAILAFMAKKTGDSLTSITHALNHRSGLLGISGLSNDMRNLLDAAQKGHQRADLAIGVFCYRLAKHIAGLAVALACVDAIVFTGGIGENSSIIRAKTMAHLTCFDVALDEQKNTQHGHASDGFIHTHEHGIAVLVIPTNEEVMIARYVNTILKEK
ncbi:MAG: acetate kinase, partial [Mariprofundaceae bacterium]|nr:acetate kinase [Mariprofundaceae bacterium]